MANKLFNLARMSSATVGTGTITLGSAVSGYLTFALAGVADGDVVSYGIKDGSSSEVGTGTYTAAGTTLSRTVTKSTNSNTAISLSGAAEVFITTRAEDLVVTTAAVKSDQQTGTSVLLAVVPSIQQQHDSACKAWAYVTNSAGTYTMQANYNVTSITKNSTGNITITFTTAFATANYAAVANGSVGAGAYVFCNTFATGSVVVIIRDVSNVALDSSFSIMCFGRQ